ncbi:DUF805 domain-containing protein [Priestia megaterium]|uniref:DUF805 domain-containing protein n=1 Tax=Priestia megaterium TaxID=1404 RepID=UPI002E202FFE|nr:DUF805 domain-containing protein [Priestia megaterium]
MKWYIKVLKNYGTFSGRASRTEYWMFVLVNFVISFILSFIQFVIDKPLFLPVIYSLLVAVPSLAVGARRLHDTGKSGWWRLITLVPLIGGIWLIILFCQPSDPKENRFGTMAKAA